MSPRRGRQASRALLAGSEYASVATVAAEVGLRCLPVARRRLRAHRLRRERHDEEEEDGAEEREVHESHRGYSFGALSLPPPAHLCQRALNVERHTAAVEADDAQAIEPLRAAREIAQAETKAAR